MQKYYQVAVASPRPAKNDLFTYQSRSSLAVGALVRVPFGRSSYNGVVVAQTDQPDFATKPLVSLNQPALPEHLIDLAKWVADYYRTSLSLVMQAILPSGSHKKRQLKSDKTIPISRPNNDHPLSADQQKALAKINQSGQTVLLHGVTGSGKTRIYLEVAAQSLRDGRSVLVLVPEITLTPQMSAEFENKFGSSRVLAWHSGLTERQRHQAWTKIVTSPEPLIIIGARSAIFAPLKNLGLIIVDECHENSYKQDNQPRYDSLMVAGQLAKLTGAKLIMGSATPSVTTYTYARLKKWPIITLDKPIYPANRQLSVIDSSHRDSFTANRYFSDLLIEQMKKSLEANEQTLIFHNRRGSARVLQCSHCGWTADCRNCHLPLILHQDQHLLRCHLCGLTSAIPHKCSNCGQMDLKFLGYGTKRLEQELARMFPEATIRRFDADNNKDESLLSHYQDILDGKVDILVGTQILTKGLDLPKLTTLGVINADAGLHMPDVFAAERTFQLLYQSIGRIGRHGHQSHAIIQTYQPDNPAIAAALGQDYKQFYDQEIKEREATFYPPRCFVLKITAAYASFEAAADKLSSFGRQIKKQYKNLAIVGPAPAFHEHVGKKYRAQLLVKATSRPVLQQIASQLPTNWQFDLDPLSLL